MTYDAVDGYAMIDLNMLGVHEHHAKLVAGQALHDIFNGFATHFMEFLDVSYHSFVMNGIVIVHRNVLIDFGAVVRIVHRTQQKFKYHFEICQGQHRIHSKNDSFYISVWTARKMDLYKRMEAIDGKRQEQDYITFLFLSPNEECLQKECQDIIDRILKKHESSKRLQNIFKRVLSDNDRVAKHSLLLFAMAYDPELLQGWSKILKYPLKNEYLCQTLPSSKHHQSLEGNLYFGTSLC